MVMICEASHQFTLSYYTLKMNYDHNNVVDLSRFHHLLSLTLVRHQCAEMEVSGQLMRHFHRAGHTFTFHHWILVISLYLVDYNQTRNTRDMELCLYLPPRHVYNISLKYISILSP